MYFQLGWQCKTKKVTQKVSKSVHTFPPFYITFPLPTQQHALLINKRKREREAKKTRKRKEAAFSYEGWP